jgi:hypothetical protein
MVRLIIQTVRDRRLSSFRLDLIFIGIGAILFAALLFFHLYNCLGSVYCQDTMIQKASLPWYASFF